MHRFSPVIRYALLPALLVVSLGSWAADWRYYGSVEETTPAGRRTLRYFYDRESVRKLHNGHTLLWTQSVAQDAAQTADPNAQEMKPQAKVYFEIDCTWKKLRPLGTFVYRPDGTEDNRTQMEPYTPMSAHALFERLGQLVCAP